MSQAVEENLKRANMKRKRLKHKRTFESIVQTLQDRHSKAIIEIPFYRSNNQSIKKRPSFDKNGALVQQRREPNAEVLSTQFNEEVENGRHSR